MSNKPQSSIDWLFDQISYIEQVYIKAAKADKSLKKGTDAILTALAIVKMREEHAKEMHHKEVVDAHFNGAEQVMHEVNKVFPSPKTSELYQRVRNGERYDEGEDYYNTKFNVKAN